MATATTSSAFVYTNLDQNRREIRLLTLQQGKLDDQPCCDIEVVSLTSRPKYVALSYVWGDEKDRASILLHDGQYSVTANLELALRYLQCIHNLERLWVDALCINQANPSEKGFQVRMMADIYSAAHRTYLWIGGPVYQSNAAIEAIGAIGSPDSKPWSSYMIFNIKQLLQRPYWTRVWMIQEAFYSKHAIVKCGYDEVDFNRFYDLVEMMDYIDSRPPAERCPENPGLKLFKFGRFPFKLLFRLCPRDRPRETPIKIDIFRWLNYSDGFASTLPRDRVFALLGIAFDSNRKDIISDYSAEKSDRQIFAEVTAYIMRRRSQTWYLLPLQMRQVGKVLDLPSWVPDWTIPAHANQIHPGPLGPQFCAGQDEAAWDRLRPRTEPLGEDYLGNPVQFRFSADFGVLILRALVIGRIVYALSVADGDRLVRDPAYKDKKWSITQLEVYNACQSWESRALTHPRSPYESSSALSEALWRTLMCDKCWDGTGPPPSDHGINYKEWKDAISGDDTNAATFDSPEEKQLLDFDFQVVTNCELRGLALTDEGYVGLVPSSTQSEDLVCVSEDGHVPFILRPEKDHYRWIGEAYVHGAMYGEAVRAGKVENVREFSIV
ncbi:hypothetical protein MMC13_006279 [Lambiella insularis]|nr:hypothetical protein [Lambiella insularis]